MTAYKLTPIGDVAGVTEVLLRDGETSLGSDPVCEARVTAEGIASIHAAIFVGADGVFIEPAQGALLINDVKAQGRTALEAGAFLWIGEPPAGILMQLVATDGAAQAAGAAASTPAAAEVVESGETAELVEEPEPAAAEVVEEFDEAQDLGSGAEAAPAPAPAPPEAVHEEFVEEAPEQVAAPVAEAPAAPATQEPEPVVEMAAEEADAALAEPHVEAHAEVDAAVDDGPAPPPAAAAQAPPAPWASAPRASEPAPAPKQDLAAWEVKPPAPAPAPEPPPSPEPAPAPPQAPKAAAKPAGTSTGAAARPRTVAPPPKVVRAPAGAVIPEPPPARSGPNPAMLGVAALLLIGGAVGAYFMLGSDEPAPVAQAPTPAPVVATPPPVVATPAVVETPPEPVPAPTEAATPEAGPTVATTAPTPGRPAPPRPTPTPAVARPTPVRPGAATPPPTTAAPAAPVAPVSPVPRLLDEARSAMTARDWPRAQRAVDEILRLEPGNAEAGTRKTEIAARIAARNRAFSTGATQVQGARPAGRGPAGFDVGGATVAQSDYMGQIQCATTPARVEEGDQYSIQCTLLNTGKRSYKVESVQVIEIVDGARRTIPIQSSRRDLEPQERTPIAQHGAAWTAQREYRFEVTVRTDKNTSFSASVGWR